MDVNTDSDKSRKIHGEGSYDLIIRDVNKIEFKDFVNPWNFHSLFVSNDETVFAWLRKNGLLANELKCHCGKTAKLNRRQRLKDKYSFRCRGGHELSMRKNSFFEGSSYNIRDLMIFMKYYIEGHTLKRCALATNMDYKHTAINWASYVRELFCQYVFDAYSMMNFEGEVEIDESVFGRKVKYHRGQPRGCPIWIFGIVERSSNKIILYPVDNRKSETLIPLIQRHVFPGSRIYSDSWAAYMKLNEVGYEHFTVVHKTTFKQKYQNVDTGETIDCHTNRIEGAWKICKDHFRRINGTNTASFEQHLAEIVWRNHFHKEDLYKSFYNLVRDVFTLRQPPHFTYRKPVFDTWTPPSAEDEAQHHITIVQESDTDSDSPSEDEPVSVEQVHTSSHIASDLSHDEPPTAESTRIHSRRSSVAVQSDDQDSPNVSTSPDARNAKIRTPKSAESHCAPVVAPRSTSPKPGTSRDTPDIADKFVTTRRKKRSRVTEETQKHWELDTAANRHAHPSAYIPVKRKEKKKSKSSCTRKQNPYAKHAYAIMSSDSDFET